MGFPSEARNPKAWISLQRVGGQGPAAGASCWSGGSEELGEVPQKDPYPLFLSGEAAPHHPPRGKVVAPFCTFTFKLTSGLDLIRMEQGNHGVQLSLVGFVRVKTKSLFKWLKMKSEGCWRQVASYWFHPLPSLSTLGRSPPSVAL